MLMRLWFREKLKRTWSIYINDERGSYLTYTTFILFVISLLFLFTSFLYFREESFQIHKNLVKQRYAIVAESGAEKFIHDIKVMLVEKEIRLEYDNESNQYIIPRDELVVTKEEILNLIGDSPVILDEVTFSNGEHMKEGYMINKDTLELYNETYIEKVNEVKFSDTSTKAVGSFYINFEVIPIITLSEDITNLNTLKVNVGFGVKLSDIKFKERTYINERGENVTEVIPYATLDIL